MTSEEFSRLIISDHVVNAINQIRRLRAEGKDKGADLVKRQLPLLCFCAAGFDQTEAKSDSRDGTRKKGQQGRWRVQEAVRLNGLYMVDYDHLDVEPKQLVEQWLQDYVSVNQEAQSLDRPSLLRAFFGGMGVVLVHETSSGRGLRLVGIADASRGNLADNQAWLSKRLGLTLDEACKDASRGSFAPMFEDIFYIDQEKLFNYEDKDYDQKYGPLYRGGHSQPTAAGSGKPAVPGMAAPVTAGNGGTQGDGSSEGSAPDNAKLDDWIKQGYHGASYHDIVDKWLELANGGEPEPGDRHRVLLKLAAHMRYITNNNPEFLKRAIAQHPLCAAYEREDPQDMANIAASACSKELYSAIPKRFKVILAAAGVQQDEPAVDADAGKDAGIDYEAWAARLEPLLAESPGLREACMHLPRQHWMGAVLAAGAMLGTYLTRCWWAHFDGRYYRLSFIVYIIGQAASGKSFLTEMDQLLMAPMQAADMLGRKAEEQYNEACKRRKSNEKAPEQPKIPVRYCPTSTSNAVFFRRLRNAIDPDVTDPVTGEPLRMHIITVESELKTATREWKKGYAAKGDLELKAFHNELAGVDYANVESANGIVQVNWNQVMSGTLDSLAEKVKPSSVLDGFVTRLALFLMPSNDFEMLERRNVTRNHERDTLLRQLGIRLEQVKGELVVPRLVDFCYDYEAELTRRADLEQDRCLDYFRKRIPVLMMRFALVRLVLRQLDAAIKGEDLTVDDSDLEFARLIGDFCLEMQVHMFGEMVMDALEKEKQSFKARGVYSKTSKQLQGLEQNFTAEDLVSAGLIDSIEKAKKKINVWLSKKYITKKEKGVYTKNF